MEVEGGVMFHHAQGNCLAHDDNFINGKLVFLKHFRKSLLKNGTLIRYMPSTSFNLA